MTKKNCHKVFGSQKSKLTALEQVFKTAGVINPTDPPPSGIGLSIILNSEGLVLPWVCWQELLNHITCIPIYLLDHNTILVLWQVLSMDGVFLLPPSCIWYWCQSVVSVMFFKCTWGIDNNWLRYLKLLVGEISSVSLYGTFM